MKYQWRGGGREGECLDVVQWDKQVSFNLLGLSPSYSLSHRTPSSSSSSSFVIVIELTHYQTNKPDVVQEEVVLFRLDQQDLFKSRLPPLLWRPFLLCFFLLTNIKRNL